jgi:TolB protein
MNKFNLSVALLMTGLAGLGGIARADLVIDITQGVSDPVPVAVVPFARAVPADGGFDVAAVVQHDLDGSGRFKSMPRKDMLAQPTRGEEVAAGAWRAAGFDYVAVGRVVATGAGLTVECDLVNSLSGQRLGTVRVGASAATLRKAAHQVSDFIFEKITGTRGAFSTRVAYVSVDGTPPKQSFQLIVADADGENPRIVLASNLPIMSPAWSPDGDWLAYVSFENQVSSVYLQQLRTGERRRVSQRAGVNGAPAFSPDGRKLALTLSGSGGNLDIYLLDLATQTLTRLTDDPAIDTESAWSPDGTQIYFTSDRGGGPQIYRLNVADPGRAQRISFGSPYNARPRVSPDGLRIAMVTLEGGNYRIAVQDLGANLRTLTKGALDESPSFAPNGMTLIYAARQGGQGTLATVAIDGSVSQRLKADRGEVREPVWGPWESKP